MNKLVLLLLFAGGCADRQHLYYKTGAAQEAAFARQAQARDVPAPKGLDAEDAQIVLSNYRTASKKQGGAPVMAAPMIPVTSGDVGSSLSEPAGGPPPGGIQLQAK